MHKRCLFFHATLKQPAAMYKTDFVCTYKRFEQIEDDEVNADMMYRAQFLQVFGLTEYNQCEINASIEHIKSRVDKSPELKELILKHPHHEKFNSAHPARDTDEQKENDDAIMEMLLVCMFAYPTMDVFHLCLIDDFKCGCIMETTRDKLLKAYSCMDGNENP
jgi:hypothetical protein